MSECILFIAGLSFHCLEAGIELLNFSFHHVHPSFTVPIFQIFHGNAVSGFIITMAVTNSVFLSGICMISADENFVYDKVFCFSHSTFTVARNLFLV